MRSLGKEAAGTTRAGLAVCRVKPMLRLALCLAVASITLLFVVRHARVSAEAVPGYADSASSESSLAPASVASSGTVVVNLSPSSSSVTKDQIFTVDIQVVAGTQPVDAAEIHLYFSQTYLQVVDAAGNPVQTIEDLSGWNAPIANQVDTSSEPARILFAAGILGTGPRPSGTFALARIRFKALWGTGGGSTPLTFGTTGYYRTDVLYGIESVLGGVENGSVTISGETPPPTPTPTQTPSPTPTATSTRTSTPTVTPPPTNTPTATPTGTVTRTPTVTPTRTHTATPSPTPQSTIEVCFQQGWLPNTSFSGAYDTYLRAWNPTDPYGSDSFLRARQDNAWRPVIKFDLAPYIPSGLSTVVVQARLSMLMGYTSNTFALNADLYRVNRSWDELTATWSSPWATAGCDAVPADREGVFAATTLLPVQSTYWAEWDVTSLVQDWVAGRAANHGVIMLTRGEIIREVSFNSSNHGEPWNRPKLCVTYFVLSATPTATLTPTPTHSPTSPYTPTPTRTSTITPTPTITLTPLPYGVPITRWFQQGVSPASYSEVTDTYLDRGMESGNFGQDPVLKLSYDGAERALLRFDLSRYIPTDAVVTLARVEVYFHLSDPDYPGAVTDVGLFEVYRPWLEDEATWRQSAIGYPWNGCETPDERAQTPAAITTLDTVGWKAWEGDGVTQLVQRWVSDPATNRGMALIGLSPRELQFWMAASSQWALTASRPKLWVVFYRRGPAETETPTPTRTHTPQPTATHTATPSQTPETTATAILTSTPTTTAIITATRTPTSTPTPSCTATGTATPTLTATATWGIRKAFLPVVVRRR